MKAKDTVRAGQENGCYAEGWANGIKEVVEFVELNMPIINDWRFKDNWQAKLKEWGIKP